MNTRGGGGGGGDGGGGGGLAFCAFKKFYTLSYYTKVKWGGFFYTFIFKAFCFLSFLSFSSFEYVRTVVKSFDTKRRS